MSSYRIIDEPSPSGLARFAVRPFWPLLAQMLAGAWLAWPWFLVNAVALGSATRRKEQLWIAAAAAGSIVVSIVVVLLLRTEALSAAAAPYVAVAMVALKLGVASWVHALQHRAESLVEHFRGPLRNGIALVIAGAILRGMFLSELPLFVALVLS